MRSVTWESFEKIDYIKSQSSLDLKMYGILKNTILKMLVTLVLAFNNFLSFEKNRDILSFLKEK